MADFQELFEKLPDGVTLHDASDGSLLETNQRFCEMLGYSRDELLELGFEDLHVDEAPYTTERAEQYIQKAAAGGPQTFEWLDETKAGDPLPVEVHLSSTTIDGEDRILAVVRDITERKRQEERFQAFIEQSTDVISVLDPDGTYQYLSPSAERILGYDVNELIGEVAFEFVHPEDRDRVMATFSEAVSNPETTATAEFRFRHGDGSWIWLESVGNNQLDNPAIEGFIVNSRDISERVERERSLERERDRLDEFAGVVSHDLRNPLNVAQGRLELAQDDCESEHLEAVNRAHGRMQQLIEDLLSLARAGEAIGGTEAVELAALAETCWRNVETDTADIILETEATIQADETRLKQLLENVLRNAIDHGGDAVTITVGDVPEGFYIEDDGPGIPADVRSRVLEPGYSTSAAGTGFGLSIVRDIAVAHDWNIEVNENPEGGARFEFTAVEVD